MKRMHLYLVLLVAGFSFATVSCKKEPEGKTAKEVINDEDSIPLDSTKVATFFVKYPDFKSFEPEIKELYKKYQYHYIWHDKSGRMDFADALYNKVNQIKSEGVQTEIPYKDKFAELFAGTADKKNPDVNDELLISCMYFFYVKNVYEGVDSSASKETGWFLPREKVSYVTYLDSLMKDPSRIKKDDKELIGQYYNLKKGLQFYQEIQKKGGWGAITLGEGVKVLKPGDSATAIIQVRKRLAATGDLKSDSGTNVYDTDLQAGLDSFAKSHNLNPEKNITPAMVKLMNVSVEDCIKTIVVNMERCRWISPDIAEAKEFISVNIPSYRLHYMVNGKPKLISNVVVGKELNQTVVFSGKMSYIVFSPYWNIPKSIIEKEVKPGIAKNKNYLEQHNMEWNNGNVRQKPGNANSLGLVKFMFPNSNNIYLHDTPAKSLFNKESRAFSHGCVRVEKARDLAVAILEGDKKWNASKIDAAMHAGKEKNYTLNHKIPVYIGYFTAWADENGKVSFFEDVYNRDNRLAHLLYNETAK